MNKPIEDYALIGDCRSAALVGRDGSIDWLCWPRFDSDACLASLLGSARNGRWLIAPSRDVTTISRRYRKDTLVLETMFATPSGRATVIDFMVPHDRGSALVRLVRCDEGEVQMNMELLLRFSQAIKRMMIWMKLSKKLTNPIKPEMESRMGFPASMPTWASLPG